MIKRSNNSEERLKNTSIDLSARKNNNIQRHIHRSRDKRKTLKRYNSKTACFCLLLHLLSAAKHKRPSAAAVAAHEKWQEEEWSRKTKILASFFLFLSLSRTVTSVPAEPWLFLPSFLRSFLSFFVSDTIFWPCKSSNLQNYFCIRLQKEMSG